MSAHNHDEEIMKRFGNTKRGNSLQKKVDARIEQDLVDIILKTNVSGLSRADAARKLKEAIELVFENEKV